MADVTKTIDIIIETKDAVKSVDNLNESIEEGTEDTKKYQKQLEETEKVTGAFTQQLDKMTGGMFSSAKGILTTIKGLKSLKVALIATGLGAVLVVIGAIATAFTKLEGPMRIIEELFGGLGAVFGELTERFGLLGESLIALISGDWESAVQSWTLAWKDLNKEVKEAYELGRLVARQTRENSVNESSRAVMIAENNRLIERQLLLSRNIESSIADRQKAIERATELQKENIALTLKGANERLQIAENEFELSPVGTKGKKSAEAIIAINNARAEFSRARLSSEIRARDLENRRVDLLRQELQVKKVITAEMVKQDALLDEAEEGAIRLKSTYIELEDQYNAMADSTEIALEVTGDAASDATEDQEGLNAALGVTSQAAKGLLDIFQGKVEGKDIFKTVLSTLGSIIGLILPGAGGVANLIGGLFEDGGLLKGPSHRQGGIWVNAEGGEGIINKRSMSIPWVSDLASQLNQIGGGVKFADGGIVAGQTAQEAQISQLSASLQEQRIVLPIEDLYSLDTKVQTIEDRSTL